MSGSRPLVGSSSRSTSARVANAATSATFWRLPFEYVRARLSSSRSKRFTQLGAVLHVDVAVEVAEQLEALLAGQLRPQAHVARHVGEVTVARLDVAGVDALDLRGTRGRRG